MTDRDTITLPREVVEKARKALTPMAYHTPPYERDEIAAILRTALAAEPTKQEPVAWMFVNLNGECEQIEYATPPTDDDSITPLYAAPPDAEALRRDAERLTDEQIDSATSKERDELLDHIYEYGTAAEGILERIRKLARAAIDAAMKEGKT